MMKKIIISIVTIGLFFETFSVALADNVTVINNGITYLKSKQDSTGKITGFGGESEWASLAFAANNIDVNSVKNPETSLTDYLLNNPPSDSSPATDWERKILAIVAIRENPTNFNGVNYIQKLESFANNNQIGDVNLLNDDIFGLLALISGLSTNSQIKQDALSFIISHQNGDGGFSWSTTPPFNTSDSNDTAAAIQALQAAKNGSLANPDLVDNAITNAKNYLLTTQKNDGGFGYDGFSDSDGSSTSWALMALNVLDMNNSVQAISAKDWLISNQESDGGFHWMAGFGSDTYTSSHALIALSGKAWILEVSATPIPTPTITPSLTPTPTPTLTPIPTITPAPTSSNNALSNPSPSPSPSPIPTPIPTISPAPLPEIRSNVTISTPSPQVLGEAIVDDKPQVTAVPKPAIDQKQLLVNGFKGNALPVTFVLTLLTAFKFLEGRRWKR